MLEEEGNWNDGEKGGWDMDKEGDWDMKDVQEEGMEEWPSA